MVTARRTSTSSEAISAAWCGAARMQRSIDITTAQWGRSADPPFLPDCCGPIRVLPTRRSCPRDQVDRAIAAMVIGAPQGGLRDAPCRRAIAPEPCDTFACHLVAAWPTKGLVVERRWPTSLASNVKSGIICETSRHSRTLSSKRRPRCWRFTNVTAPLLSDGHPCERPRALHRHHRRLIRGRPVVITLALPVTI